MVCCRTRERWWFIHGFTRLLQRGTIFVRRRLVQVGVVEHCLEEILVRDTYWKCAWHVRVLFLFHCNCTVYRFAWVYLFTKFTTGGKWLQWNVFVNRNSFNTEYLNNHRNTFVYDWLCIRLVRVEIYSVKILLVIVIRYRLYSSEVYKSQHRFRIKSADFLIYCGNQILTRLQW